MSDTDSTSATPKRARDIALNSIGAALSGLGSALTVRASEIGSVITKHPELSAGIAAGVGTLLYAWGVWTYSLLKRDTKRERVKDALEKGRLVCPCTETGEVMTYHHSNTYGSTISYWACPNCENCELVEPNGSVLISGETIFHPPMPGRVHRSLIRSADEHHRRYG
jgi:hypothetical protein